MTTGVGLTEFCHELGIREEMLSSITLERELVEWTRLSPVLCVNSVVVEFNKWLSKKQLHICMIFEIISALFDVDILSEANKTK